MVRSFFWMYAPEISRNIEDWSFHYLGAEKVKDLKQYLVETYPSIEFNVDRKIVKLGALIGGTSLEVKNKASLRHIEELKANMTNYLLFSLQLVVIFSDPEKDIVARFKSYLFENELTKVVWVVEI